MTINCKGKLIDLSSPVVMGILNLTPDSFYDGGKFQDDRFALKQVEKMLFEGAMFVDLGAYSSRPNAAHISEKEELQRLMPVLHVLIKEFPEILVSVDTFRSVVAKEAVNAGACMVNDISAGMLDDAMLKTVATLHVPYIMMHMRGTPQTMQQKTDYDNVLKEILLYFSERTAAARALGIIDLIVDPGFGFSKTPEQSFEILNQLEL
ncbi:MAG TPA: dihydropteroate synthase, partial [Aquaticitalea sp.]|nr:dihydropteroate synthase [Aquaticitalea sp.]